MPFFYNKKKEISCLQMSLQKIKCEYFELKVKVSLFSNINNMEHLLYVFT